jgi:hypothetical protein
MTSVLGARRSAFGARAYREISMRTTVSRAALVASSVILIACSWNRAENPWLNPRPADLAGERWQELPQARFREVKADMRTEAVRMLATDPVWRLPGRDVQRFLQADFSDQPSGRFYLLRAVSTAGQNGGYQVLIRGRAVTVRYAARAAGTATVQSAVVADLEHAPERVYVEVSGPQ